MTVLNKSTLELHFTFASPHLTLSPQPQYTQKAIAIIIGDGGCGFHTRDGCVVVMVAAVVMMIMLKP